MLNIYNKKLLFLTSKRMENICDVNIPHSIKEISKSVSIDN